MWMEVLSELAYRGIPFLTLAQRFRFEPYQQVYFCVGFQQTSYPPLRQLKFTGMTTKRGNDYVSISSKAFYLQTRRAALLKKQKKLAWQTGIEYGYIMKGFVLRPGCFYESPCLSNRRYRIRAWG